MKYSLKNVKFDLDYKSGESEHGFIDFNIDEINIEIDKSEFATAYDTIGKIVKDVVSAVKEIKTAEFASSNKSCSPYKWGKKKDREVFTKK